MNQINTRKKALQILEQSEKAGRYSSDLLAREAHNRELNYPLLQKLVKGVLQWRSRLDTEIKARWPSKELPGHELLNVLRIATYQLLFLERVPSRLIENETMRLAQQCGQRGEAGAVRKVIAAMAGERGKKGRAARAAVPAGEGGLESPDAIAQYYSHPLWIVQRWVKQFGAAETQALCAADNQPWPVCIRTNTLRISTHQLRKNLAAEGVQFKPAHYLADCTLITRLPRAVRLTSLASFRTGLFQVQDESAALVSALLNPRPGSTVIDLCAAPGGKTTHLAQLMRNKGQILALDRDARRLKLVEENARRLGLRIIKTRAVDAGAFKGQKPADYVLLDAPCSGLGVLGRKSDLRWSRGEESIEELVALQKKLLWHAAGLVRPGGKLLYSTCTVERAEDEAVIEEFLKTHKNFCVERPGGLQAELLTGEGYLRTFPHRHQMGGAFAALLVNRG